MKPEEALAQLDEVAKAQSLNRDAHKLLEQCIAVLAEAIKPKEDPKKARLDG